LHSCAARPSSYNCMRTPTHLAAVVFMENDSRSP
jgi:hypothetical protein